MPSRATTPRLVKWKATWPSYRVHKTIQSVRLETQWISAFEGQPLSASGCFGGRLRTQAGQTYVRLMLMRLQPNEIADRGRRELTNALKEVLGDFCKAVRRILKHPDDTVTLFFDNPEWVTKEKLIEFGKRRSQKQRDLQLFKRDEEELRTLLAAENKLGNSARKAARKKSRKVHLRKQEEAELATEDSDLVLRVSCHVHEADWNFEDIHLRHSHWSAIDMGKMLMRNERSMRIASLASFLFVERAMIRLKDMQAPQLSALYLPTFSAFRINFAGRDLAYAQLEHAIQPFVPSPLAPQQLRYTFAFIALVIRRTSPAAFDAGHAVSEAGEAPDSGGLDPRAVRSGGPYLDRLPAPDVRQDDDGVPHPAWHCGHRDGRLGPADDILWSAVPVARTAQPAREAGAAEADAKTSAEEAAGTFTHSSSRYRRRCCSSPRG